MLIAVSAALLCKETFIVTGISYQGFSIYLITFAFTLYAYLYYPGQQFFTKKRFDEINKTGYALFAYLLPIACLFALFIFFIDAWQSIIIFCSIVVLALFYFGLGFRGTAFKIRKIYFAKTILLALVWSVTTVLLPVSFAGQNIWSSTVLFAMARRFFFIAALTIPFEMRDRHKDIAAGDKSFVNLIGITKSKMIALALLFIYLMLALIQFTEGGLPLRTAIAMAISFLLSAILVVLYNTEKKNSSFILFCIDGMLMIQFFLIMKSTTFF